MNDSVTFEGSSLLCGNCFTHLEDSGNQAFKIRDITGVHPGEVQIADALAYIYGISWDDFRISIQKEIYPGSCAEINSKNFTEGSAVNFCNSCAIILSDNYHNHRELELASRPSSIIHYINIFRRQNWKSVAFPQFEDPIYISPSESANHQNVGENSSELSDPFDFEDAEDLYRSISPEVEYKPEYKADLRSSEPECKQTIPNPDCSKYRSPTTTQLRLRKLSVKLERLSEKNLPALNRNKNKSIKTKKDSTKGKSSGKNRWRSLRGLTSVSKCKICGKVLHSKFSMQQHLITRHGTEEERQQLKIQCGICGKVLACKKYMASHLKRKHGTEEEQLQRKIPCEICGKVLASSETLKTHLKLHDDSSKQYVCATCGKTFRQKIHLTSHEVTHTERTRSFLCGQCGKTYTSKIMLTAHEKVHGEEQFPCDICSKVFNTKVAFNKHKRNTHSTERKYVCDECGKSFKFLKDFTLHKKLHKELAENGGRPIQCDQCGKELKHSQALKKHQRRKHRDDLKKIYKCSLCDKILSCGASLRTHKKLIHKLFLNDKLGSGT